MKNNKLILQSKALLTRYPKGNDVLNVEDLLSPVRQSPIEEMNYGKYLM